MFNEIEKIVFSDFLQGTKSEASNQRSKNPGLIVIFSKGEKLTKKGEKYTKTVTAKLSSKAAKELNLVLSDEEVAENRAIEDAIDDYKLSKAEMDKLASFAKKALVTKISTARESKKFKTVTFFTGKNAAGEDVLCMINSTDVGNAVPENMRQRVSASTHSVKLKLDEAKKLYELNGLPTGDDFNDAQDMGFDLKMSKTQIGETIVDTCYLVKRQAVVAVVKDPDAPEKVRSEKQDALSDKMYDWFEAERQEGRIPSVRKYWKAHAEEKKAVA